jgi:hypothetical protein
LPCRNENSAGILRDLQGASVTTRRITGVTFTRLAIGRSL